MKFAVRQALLSAVALLGVLFTPMLRAECQLVRQDDSYQHYKLSLPDGQDSAECRHPTYALDADIPFDSIPFGGLKLEVQGEGLLEVDVRWAGSDVAAHGGILGLVVTRGDSLGVTASYGDVVLDPSPKIYVFEFAANLLRLRRYFTLWDSDMTHEEAWAGTELVMTVRRVNQTCWMKAWVTGDVPVASLFHGDVAWFRTSDEPVKKGLMMGTASDTDLAEAFSTQSAPSAAGALDLAAQLGFITEEEKEELEPEVAAMDEAQNEVQGEDASFAEWLRQETRAEEGEAGDTFGLNLVAIDLDADHQTEIAAAQMLTSAFSLALSGNVVVSKDDDGTSMLEIRPSVVQATIGLGDQGGNRIPFGLGELSGTFSPTGRNRDFIVGFLIGELESEGKYSLEGMVPHGTGAIAADEPRVLKIGIVTKFAARRGPFSCTH